MEKYDIDQLARDIWAQKLEYITSLTPEEQLVATQIVENGQQFVAEKKLSKEVRSLNEEVLATEGHKSYLSKRAELGVFPGKDVDQFFFQLETRQFAAHSRGEVQIRPDYLRNDGNFPNLVLSTMLSRDSKITKINGIDARELRAHAESHGMESTTRVLQEHTIGQDPEQAFEAGREFSRIIEQRNLEHERDVEARKQGRERDPEKEKKENKDTEKERQERVKSKNPDRDRGR
ncbi:MAG: hypothetical protein AB8D78_01610 [Akkermansiaceae bacterium]